jgi:hypothetical protein
LGTGASTDILEVGFLATYEVEGTEASATTNKDDPQWVCGIVNTMKV